MPSFDVVSELNMHEVVNAVDQATRELEQRYDFKGTDSTFELVESTVTLKAPADFQLKQMLDILKLRVTKRGIDIGCMEIKEPEIALTGGGVLRLLAFSRRLRARQPMHRFARLGVLPIRQAESFAAEAQLGRKRAR